MKSLYYIIESEDFFQKHEIERKGDSIGFSEKEQKWYGWSHRAIYGFGIGHEIKKGACGYNEMIKLCPSGKIKTLEQAKQIAKIFTNSVV